MAPPPGPQIEFRPGVPDLSSFPRRDWLWAVGEACRTAPKADLTYGDPRGSAVLRQVLASYLRRVRGAVADPERMVICAGFAQGLGPILRSLAAEGAGRVAVEEPGPAYREIVAGRAGIQAVPVPVDERGINVAPDRVALLGSVSKPLAPGLRLGWIAAIGDLLR
jgi:GntR family transcriptional regulator/MocR family aminotransferase